MADTPGRILVVRLGSLGDLVHALPAVAALRRAFPAAEIDWLVDRVHRPFLDLVTGLSDIVELRQPNLRGWLEVRRVLRRRRYDVALDFQGLIKSAVLARMSGARRVLGFDRAALREPFAALFYTEAIAVGERGHVIDKNLRLAAAVGAAATPREFPIAIPSSRVRDEVEVAVRAPFAVLNCGAAWPNKRWPPDRFGHTAAFLWRQHGLKSVVMWGPGEEGIAADIVRAAEGAAVAAPATTLGDLVAVLSAARLMVSGDTGPTHIAAALGIPVVALFGPTTSARNGPWHADDISLDRYDRCDCHYQRQCRHGFGRDWCLASIGEDDVARAIDTRLRSVSR